MSRPLTLILAATVPALGIGKGGVMPWKLAREMKYFRQVTQGNIVVMGRKTWDSIPARFRPLKGRTNVVISRNDQLEVETGVVRATSLKDALEKVQHVDGSIFIMGGAQLYHAALELPETTHILLTEISDHDGGIDCDTFFAFNNETQWEKQSETALRNFIGPEVELESVSVDEGGLHYEFTLWKR